MGKVTLLGDSIREIGYGAKVAQLLAPDFEVYQPAENCRFSKFTLWGITNDWKPDMIGSEVVHWNNGLWDSYDCGYGPFCTIDEYLTNMLLKPVPLRLLILSEKFMRCNPVYMQTKLRHPNLFPGS